ncbi:MAG TPA: DUF5916 domain-containing protein [Longimicrobium sp.]
MTRRTFGILLPACAALLAAVPSARAQEAQAAAVAVPAGAAAAAPASRVYTMGPAAGPVQVDGRMDEAAWAGAAAVDLPYESYPGENAAPPVRTECRVTYDAQALYFGCTAHDPDPASIRARLADRDGATADDYVGIVVDPFQDRRYGYVFRVNPHGVQMDAAFSQVDGREDASWDALWTSAARITEEGYVVEAAIPFKALRFPRLEGVQTWGFIAERAWPRTVRHLIRSMPTDRDQDCLLCQADRLSGLRDIAPGRGVQVNPTLTMGRTDRSAPAERGVLQPGQVQVEPGLTARWAITPNLALSATANPDFSQVEADVAQLDVNTRFALAYPEKRPFFLEGADLFQTFAPVVFTRSVADPAGGIKVVGKEGRDAVGAFIAQDRVTNLLFPSNRGSQTAQLGDGALAGAFRYRRDVGRASTLGMVYTGRMSEGYANHVVGVDGLLRLSPANNLRFQYAQTSTEYPDSVAAGFGQPERRFGGHALITQLTHASRGWSAYAQYQDLGRGFRADVGFAPRVDVRVARTQAERVIWSRGAGWFTRLSAGVFAERLQDQHGLLTDQAVAAVATYAGPMQSRVELRAGPRSERVNGTLYQLRDARINLEARPTGNVTLRLGGRFGDEVDYANGREAGVVRLDPAMDLRLGRRVMLNLGYSMQRLRADGQEILSANLLQVRGVYHFDVRTFVRAVVQYQTTERNQEMFVNPVAEHSENLFTQLLFAYKLNPESVVYVGYTDTRLGDADLALTQTGRSLFLKFGYAWSP